MSWFRRGPKMHRTRPAEAKGLVDAGAQFIDVRSRGECRGGMPAGAKNIPLASLEAQWQHLDKERPVVCICAMGMRSASAGRLLLKHGFSDVHNVTGGTAAWRAAGLPWN